MHERRAKPLLIHVCGSKEVQMEVWRSYICLLGGKCGRYESRVPHRHGFITSVPGVSVTGNIYIWHLLLLLFLSTVL